MVVDITSVPYVVVAKYRNNEIKPLALPELVKQVADAYNNAYIMVEINDVGGQIADALHYDLEYENLIMTQMRGRLGQIVGSGFGDKATDLGVRTTKAVKKIGCSNLKQLVESDKMILKDFDIIVELSNFVAKGSSFEGDEGATDDLVMCLVLFAWLTNQTFFKELTNDDIRRRLYQSQQKMIEEDMAPFGFMDDGINYVDQNMPFVDEDGDYWTPTQYNR